MFDILRLFFGGEEKQRRKRRKIFGEGRYLFLGKKKNGEENSFNSMPPFSRNLAILQIRTNIFQRNALCKLILFIPLHPKRTFALVYLPNDWTNSSQVSASL